MNLFKILLTCSIFMLLCTYCTNPVQEEYYINSEGSRYLLSLDDNILYDNLALSSSGDQLAASGSYKDFFVYEMDLQSPQEAKRITDRVEYYANIGDITLLQGGNLYLYKVDDGLYINSIDSSFKEKKYDLQGNYTWHYRDSCIFYTKRFYAPDSQIINIIDIITGSDKNIFSTQSLTIYDFDYHPEKNILAYTIRNEETSNIRILVIHNLNTDKKDTINTNSYIGELQFSHNGHYLAWEGYSNNLYILNLDTNMLTTSSWSGVHDIQWRSDDQKILLRSSSYGYQIYDIINYTYASFEPLREYGSIKNYVWTDDDKIRFASYDDIYTLQLYSIPNRKILYSAESSINYKGLNWINDDAYLFYAQKNTFNILDISALTINSYSDPLNDGPYGSYSGNNSKWVLIGCIDKIYLLDLLSLLTGSTYYIKKDIKNFNPYQHSWISWMQKDDLFSFSIGNGILYISKLQDNDIKDVKMIPGYNFTSIKWAPYSETIGDYALVESAYATEGLQLFFLNSTSLLSLNLDIDLDINQVLWSADGKSIIYTKDYSNLYQQKVIHEPQ